MLGYNMIGLLYALYHTNLIGAAFIKETENAIEYLDRGEKAIQAEAELIAKKLKGKVPVIYCDIRLQAIATRFQQQLNENAKHFAHVNVFPEMNHNELVGWQYPENLISSPTRRTRWRPRFPRRPSFDPISHSTTTACPMAPPSTCCRA
jgi:glucose/mannose-6-phosphate isomerase